MRLTDATELVNWIMVSELDIRAFAQLLLDLDLNLERDDTDSEHEIEETSKQLVKLLMDTNDK